MRKLLLAAFTLLLFTFMAQAQAPQAFKYQAVVRDAAGQVLPDQEVGLQIELFGQDTIYRETHTATTNAFGLVNLEIGRGTALFGDFATIDWNQSIGITISLDAAGGTDYEPMGASELLSVPYALYAANGGSSDDDGDPTNEIQTLMQTGAEVTLSNGGGTITVNDADADPANELELPADAQTGDLAYYNGTAWQRLPVGIPGAVLTMGADGIPVWYRKFQEFFGTYNVSEICEGQSFSYPIVIGPSTSSNENEIILQNFGAYNLPVTGTLDGNNLTIDYVGGGFTITGTGTFNGDVLTYTNTTSLNGLSENCTGTATKQ